jgi:hypothetical protein
LPTLILYFERKNNIPKHILNKRIKSKLYRYSKTYESFRCHLNNISKPLNKLAKYVENNTSYDNKENYRNQEMRCEHQQKFETKSTNKPLYNMELPETNVVNQKVEGKEQWNHNLSIQKPSQNVHLQHLTKTGSQNNTTTKKKSNQLHWRESMDIDNIENLQHQKTIINDLVLSLTNLYNLLSRNITIIVYSIIRKIRNLNTKDRKQEQYPQINQPTDNYLDNHNNKDHRTENRKDKRKYKNSIQKNEKMIKETQSEIQDLNLNNILTYNKINTHQSTNNLVQQQRIMKKTRMKNFDMSEHTSTSSSTKSSSTTSTSKVTSPSNSNETNNEPNTRMDEMDIDMTQNTNQDTSEKIITPHMAFVQEFNPDATPTPPPIPATT